MEKTEVGIQAEAKAKAQMKEICSLNKIGKARLEEQEHQTSVFTHYSVDLGDLKQGSTNREEEIQKSVQVDLIRLDDLLRGKGLALKSVYNFNPGRLGEGCSLKMKLRH